ncbi:MAG: hypothetical protein ABIO70_20330 [Pseudomonadota bacterium]
MPWRIGTLVGAVGAITCACAWKLLWALMDVLPSHPVVGVPLLLLGMLALIVGCLLVCLAYVCLLVLFMFCRDSGAKVLGTIAWAFFTLGVAPLFISIFFGLSLDVVWSKRKRAG